MINFGLHGFSHGGAKALAAGADIITNAGAGRRIYYLLPGKARRRARAPDRGGPAGIVAPAIPACIRAPAYAVRASRPTEFARLGGGALLP